MDYTKKWKIIGNLGEGGQGKVYRVFKLDVDSDIKSNLTESLRKLTEAVNYRQIPEEHYEKFYNSLLEIIRTQDPSQHAALKVLHDSEQARNARLANKRIKDEIKVMSENLHANLVRILEVDPDFKWYISEFYPNGTLGDKLEIFKGSFTKAIKAIRPLVEGVAKLHEKGYVHRDIKPHNIFLNSSNDMILGDFGLVYSMDDQHTRFSETYENVGSRDWMPTWAMGVRLEEVKPSFDVFTLGKVLWSMVSGKQILQLWYFNRKQFNVEKMYPDSRNIKFANKLFGKCIVEDEENCLPDAGALLDEIDKILSIVNLGAESINLNTERICKVCGKGKYELVVNEDIVETANFGFSPTGDRRMIIFSCSYCGNVPLFTYEGKLPRAWE